MATDYERTWDEFWAPIVAPDGTVNLDQVKRELHDWHVAMGQVSIAYCHVTSGRLSKPNTDAGYVTSAHDEAVADAEERGRLYGKQELLLHLLKEGAPPLTDEVGFAKLREVEAALAGGEFELIVLDRDGVPIESIPGFESLEQAVEEAEYQADHQIDTAKVEIVDEDSVLVTTVRPRSAVR